MCEKKEDKVDNNEKNNASPKKYFLPKPSIVNLTEAHFYYCNSGSMKNCSFFNPLIFIINLVLYYGNRME